MVVAIVVAILILAIPLYLLRTPAAPSKEPKNEVPPAGFAPSVPAGVEQEEKDERLTIDEPIVVKCSSSAGVIGRTGRLCDSLPYFEKVLQQAITESIDCAPRTGEKGSLNYVLTVDFTNKRLHVFPGASGKWKGPQARRATQCVKRGLPAPDWDKIVHNYRYYEIAMLTHYAPPVPTDMPLFE